MPDLIGLTEAQARAEIGDAGLAVGRVRLPADPDVARDKVIEQDPNRDQFVDPGTEVDLVVSTGKPLVDGALGGRPEPDEARATLEGASWRSTFAEKDSDEPPGQVVETDPAGGPGARGQSRSRSSSPTVRRRCRTWSD